jgi:hypothetical protein
MKATGLLLNIIEQDAKTSVGTSSEISGAEPETLLF